MSEAVLVAGGGIGGAAAALALARAGFAVKLFEARPDPAEAGAGLQLGANAVKALRMLGLEDAVAAAASRPTAIELRLPGSGRVVSRVALGAAHEARYGAPYFHLHRADLHRILFEAARAHPNVEMTLGCGVVRSAHGKSGAEVTLADGREVSGLALIGADGVRSVLRAGVAGRDEPRFAGMLAWRAVVPATEANMATPPIATVWMGRGRHLVHYPLTARREINLIGVVEQADWKEESWVSPGDPAAMRADFAGWSAETDALLGRVETAWRWALHEHKPLSVWSAGRVALLGDACHAMPPFLAQGAGMALEDAVVLANRLAGRRDDIARALRDYGEARRDRTARVQKASWANAWRFHLRHPVLRTLVYGALGAASAVAPGAPGRMYDWLYSYDPAMA
ncbi:6-hydroxynicotinate 3-monooxygenase [Alphaproteobacteria bacterium SO-S41]|nr:6-hydroxynicotinate 3-monooxygenase [Alphaproteobacteria bacterium SO-S41]